MILLEVRLFKSGYNITHTIYSSLTLAPQFLLLSIMNTLSPSHQGTVTAKFPHIHHSVTEQVSPEVSSMWHSQKMYILSTFSAKRTLSLGSKVG